MVSPVKVRNKFSITSTGFSILVWSVSVVCLLCIISGFISPANYWFLALFSLVFHYIYVINLLILLLCLLKRKKLFILPFVPFILGVHTIQGVFQTGLFTKKMENTDKEIIKVLSYNVRLFDLYNWSNSENTRIRIFDFLQMEAPDILCIQEFYSSDDKGMNNLDTLTSFLKAKFTHVEYTFTQHGKNHWGIATFSKFPVINKGVIYFGKRKGNVCIYTDVLAYGDTLRIFNTHLESIRLKKEDYKFIENIENADEDQTVTGSVNILKRMRKAYKKRALEAELVDSALKASPYKHILCGDFNDPPGSYTYSVLAKDMKDAFRESGQGFSETYIGPFPAYRIDYIFHDKSIRSFNYRKIDKKLSDHYPVACEIVLN